MRKILIFIFTNFLLQSIVSFCFRDPPCDSTKRLLRYDSVLLLHLCVLGAQQPSEFLILTLESKAHLNLYIYIYQSKAIEIDQSKKILKITVIPIKSYKIIQNPLKVSPSSAVGSPKWDTAVGSRAQCPAVPLVP